MWKGSHVFVYLHTDTRSSMHTSTRLPSVLLSQIASGKTCVFSERTGDRAGALQSLGLPTASQWQAPLEKDRTVRCPASASPKWGGTDGCVYAALDELQKRAQWVQFPFCRRGYSHCSRSLTPNRCDEYFTSHTSSSHLSLAVFPAVQHVSLGCCRNEQQYVSSVALLGRWLPLRQTGCTAILIISFWFHLWGKISYISSLFFILLLSTLIKGDLGIYSVENSVWRDIKKEHVV